MAKGDFVWSDLSTFRVPVTKSFYAGLFDWTYHRLQPPYDASYEVASTPSGEAAGLFGMPRKFREMGLPSFWMPYFSVDDVEATCALATRLGGRAEVPPLAWSDDDRIALIRDPLGAGFTVRENAALPEGESGHHQGHRIGCSLYISDISAVRDFYEALFGWRIAAYPAPCGDYPARNAQGTLVASILELSEDRRGRYQYWGVQFGVDDLSKAVDYIEKNGGEIVEQDRTSGQLTILAKDPDGAAFFLGETSRQPDQPKADQGGGLASKWKTILGLIILCVAVLYELNWVWGALFILWTIPALRSGKTFFVETVTRRENPVLFWLIVAIWIGLSAYLIISDLFMWGGPSSAV